MRKYFNNPDFQGVVIVTIGTYVAAFFSYLFQFFLGRLLSIEDYGLFNAYLAISYILGVPSYVLSTSLVKYVASLSGKHDYKKLSTMYRKFQFITVLFGFIIGALIVIFREPMSAYLKSGSNELTILYGLVIAFSYIIIVPFAYLQGYLRYRSYSLSNIVAGFSRFLFPVALLFFGLGLSGVFVGLVISAIVTYFVSRILLSRNLKQLESVDTMGEYSKLFIYSFPVLFINLALILLNNIDLIMVKKLFSSTDAGYYAGTVTLGKILLFGSSTIGSVMFPRLANEYSKGKNFTKTFLFFFILQVLVVGIGTLAFCTLPGLFTNLFFGHKFEGSILYLPSFSIFVAFYVLFNFLIMFFLAIEKTYIYLLLVPAVILQYFLLSNAHSITQVITINTYITGALFVVLLLLSVFALSTVHKNKTI